MDASITLLDHPATLADMEKRPFPRDSLARNLRYLMDREKLSEPELARKSGVAQKTVNNVLHGRSSPTLDTVEALAACFNLNLWQLIMPDLPADLATSPSLSRLLKSYEKADEGGRDLINRVAERESHYKAS